MQSSCGSCSKPATMICTRCKRVHYCSRDCQKVHWRTHKKTCISPELALQELGSIVDSMSLQEALASVEAAKKEIARLERSRELAMEQYNLSKKEVDDAKRSEEKPSNYGEKTFWEQRYASTNISAIPEGSDDKGTYEWYLSYERLRPLLLSEIGPSMLDSASRFLIAGCGNSTLCEDLSKDVRGHITGCDYSDSIVALMEQRRHERGLRNIRYIRADLVAAHQELKSDYFSIVIDKGTLDAILSASEAKSSGDLENPVGYLAEMSRVLLKNSGIFILVSNMPQDVLTQALALCTDKVKHATHQLALTKTLNCVSDAEKPVYFHVLINTVRKSSLARDLMAGLLTGDVSGLVEQLQKGFTEFEEDEEMTTPIETASEFNTNIDMSSFPEVRISLDLSSDFFPGTNISVAYSFVSGSWQDGDFISVRAPFASPDDNDTFEYVLESSASDVYATQTLAFSLPDYGGCYEVAYVRSFRIGRQIVCKDLSRPIPFKVPFSIYPYYPDDSLPVISAKLLKLGRQYTRIFRRRGGGPIADASRDRRKLTIMFEDLANIKTILLSAWPHDDGTYVVITRTSVWIYAVSDESQVLLIETDITHKTGEICETETCYGQLIIPSGYVIQDVRGSGCIQGEENDSKICIRLPYSKLDSKAPTYDLSRFDMPEEIMDSAVISSLEIQCSFCCASLFSQGSISKSQDLPSGMLDHIIHDLICCENPSHPLSVNDMSCMRGKIFVGPICLMLNPNDSIPASIDFSCKQSQTLLGAMSFQLTQFSSLSNSSKRTSEISLPVDFLTCLANCHRCGEYLGDAQLKLDQELDSVPLCTEVPVPISPGGAQPSCCLVHKQNFGSFEQSDIRTLKIQLDRIRWKSPSLQRSKEFTIEMICARAMLTLSQIHRISQFRLMVAFGPVVDTQEESSFFVKIINKEYSMFLQPPQNNQNSTSSLSLKKRDCLKIMITSGSSIGEDHGAIQHTDTNIGKLRERTKLKDGVVIDLPLLYDDYIEIRSLLLDRSQYFQNTKHSGKSKEEADRELSMSFVSILYTSRC